MGPWSGLGLAAAALLAAGCAGPREAGAAPAPGPSAAPARAEEPPRAPAEEGRVLRLRGPGARLDAPPPRPEGPDGEAEAPVPPGALRTTYLPGGGLLYDPYLAAPRQSRSAAKLMIPAGAGEHVRIENTLGLNRSLFRWTSEDRPDAGTEVQFEAAVFGRFDLHEEWDMDASDWRFGIPFVRREGDLAWKIHLYHLTSHLGDEYIARTGAKQIKYHLEEAAGGVSWDVSEGSRVYGEAATAIYAGDPTGNGRVQAGFEWAGRKRSSGLSPYFAVDIQARNEQNWNPGKVVAVGLAYGRRIRMSLEYYHGRDTQTQFMKEQIRYVAVGISFDF